MMLVQEHLREAWYILTRNKIRSFLTMLGIIIGITAVIVIMSVGAGAQSLILNQIKGLGSNLVGILPGKSEESGPPAATYGIVITTLKNSDAEALTSGEFPFISAASSYVRGADIVDAYEQQMDTTFVGVSYSYPEVESITMRYGQFFSLEDERTSARTAVLGSAVAKELFDDQDPVGQTVRIKRTNFTVVGVVSERGISAFQDQDNQVFVPVTTAQKLLLGIDYVNFIRVKIDSADNVSRAMIAIQEKLREQHDIIDPEEDDFSVRSTNQGLEALTQITNALKFFLAAIAALSLLVGGIGIMNIMLAAVEERTREIGLRKALGATNRRIVEQFLVETVLITSVAGVIGILAGCLIAVLVALIARGQGYDWDLVITPTSILLGCVTSIAIGFLFGVSPARRAAALKPIEALRYE